MAKKYICLVLGLLLLLSGCGPLLNRSYASEEAHRQFSDEKDADILRAETYTGLISALLHLITQGDEEGIIRLYEYSGEVKQDLDRACLEMTQNDPLGNYAVDYMKYDLSQVMTYVEARLEIVYRKTPEQIAAVTSVTGASAILGELRDALGELRETLVLKVSYADPAMTPGDVENLVREAYYDVPQSAFGLPEAKVNLYPQETAGQQRMVEISLAYPAPVADLKLRQKALVETADGMVLAVKNLSEEEKWAEIAYLLDNSPRQRGETAEDILLGTPGGPLESASPDKGLALATVLLAQRGGLNCRVVEGAIDGEVHLWNIVQINGKWQHTDLSRGPGNLWGDAEMWEQGYTWSEDVPACATLE